MKKVIIVRYAELFLKGKNKGYFERMFVMNMEKSLKGVKHEIRRVSGRYLVEGFEEDQAEEVLSRLQKVFGTHTLSVALVVPTNAENIFEAAKELCKENGTFKVDTHRVDKSFPQSSMEFSAWLGGQLLALHPNLRVDVHKPDFIINVDIRENGVTMVFSDFIQGAGGMPVGTAGKGLLLISGGIDSPVAGHMIAKRGMKIECLHFHSYPYTNLQAKEKVEDLAKIIASYNGGDIVMHCVSVTHIQETIHKNCTEDYMITLLRRFMMRIAERVAKEVGAQCLITGESLGQVASQTVEGMTSSNAVIEDLPVLRPLCGFDKNEIIERSRAIGTYETSILPYEDCCTVFLPKFPVTKPKMKDVLAEEAKLDVDALIEEAMLTYETIEL
ncbi:MAG: tRNA 4-thiouridine(8) synthase ThiI [Clostridia bacterium]|nr:tRNA 4-thiouridine(8) synthase ThiI [Clostridia bacterium]